MKISIPALVGGTLLLLGSPVLAQNAGTSHPEELKDDIVVTAPPNSVVTVTPPAPQAQATPAQPEVYQAYKPYHPDGRTTEPAHPGLRTPVDDPDGIVTTAPYSEHELSAGTLLRAHLVGTLSTETTKPGSHFVATLSQNVEHNGRVILPVGASLQGRVTSVRSGSRLSGGASIHLEPESVTLPDGTLYHLTAQVVDLDGGHSAHVNDEGTIVGGNHTKGQAITLGATTGGGAITGAALGGGVGAAVGAGIGAGVGTILWLNQDRQQSLLDGTELVFSLNRPMDLTPSTTPIVR